VTRRKADKSHGTPSAEKDGFNDSLARRDAETPAAAHAPLAGWNTGQAGPTAVQSVRHRETTQAKLDALTKAGAQTIHTHLLDKIPQLAASLGRLPERIQAALFQAFDIQCLYKDDMNQSPSSPPSPPAPLQTVAAILNDVGCDPASTTPQPQPATHPFTLHHNPL
jgi:hypothetical protein